ncbi:unnamed protein product [Leptosia nina]|uniref:Uncharacterized protein n=1 Tax=Leptosia nina TaxID=320188 RepID=A0AAV1JHP2_9NEOP
MSERNKSLVYYKIKLVDTGSTLIQGHSQYDDLQYNAGGMPAVTGIASLPIKTLEMPFNALGRAFGNN